jgi:DNA-binding GntR family transcriptional regulator
MHILEKIHKKFELFHELIYTQSRNNVLSAFYNSSQAQNNIFLHLLPQYILIFIHDNHQIILTLATSDIKLIEN